MDNNLLFFLLVGIGLVGVLLSSLKAILLRDEIPDLPFKITFEVLLGAEIIIALLFWFEVLSAGTTSIDVLGYMEMDIVSASILVIANLLFFIAGLFSWYYMKDESLGFFGILYFMLQLGLTLTLMSSHFFAIFVFWELMVLSGYILVIFERRDESYEAGFKYLIMSSAGSLFLLMGIGLLTMLSGGLGFDEFATLAIIDTFTGKLAVAFILIGFGVTAGIFGMNQWLPDAHPAAPAPVSALLSGIIVKAGIYGIYRTMTVLVPSVTVNNSASMVLIILGIITMTEGNIMVIAQLQRDDIIDIKRILAYSTTVHLGYLLLVVGINSDLARLGLLYHILNHALAKGLLFLMTGYLIHEFHTRNVKDLRSLGIGYTNKIFAFSMFVGLFSLGGLPLTGGFISKLLVLLSLFEQANIATGGNAALLYWVLFFAVVNSAFAFGGYLWIVKDMIFTKPENEEAVKLTMPWVKWIFLSIAVLILILGIFPQAILSPISDLF